MQRLHTGFHTDKEMYNEICAWLIMHDPPGSPWPFPDHIHTQHPATTSIVKRDILSNVTGLNWPTWISIILPVMNVLNQLSMFKWHGAQQSIFLLPRIPFTSSLYSNIVNYQYITLQQSILFKQLANQSSIQERGTSTTKTIMHGSQLCKKTANTVQQT